MDAKKIEKALHAAFAVDRNNKRREFFTTEPQRIIVLLEAIATEDVTPSVQKVLDETTSPEEKRTQQAFVAEIRERRSRLKFSEIDIPPGTELVFVKDPTKKCTVVDGEQSVEYEGKRFDSLADLARKLFDYEGQWRSAPMLFTYQGDLLSDLRKK
jgi:hypothetical protein